LAIKKLEKNWINKELSLLIIKSKSLVVSTGVPKTEPVIAKIKSNQQFLTNTVKVIADIAAQQRPVALFGTTYSAKWLSYIEHLQVKYFVDENPELLGTRIDGIEVVSPHAVPEDITIILAFPVVIAEAIRSRLQAEIKAKLIIPASSV